MDGSYFRPWLEDPDSTFNITTYTQGRGEDRSISGLTDELASVIGNSEEEQVFLLAHSFGSVICFEYLKKFGSGGISGVILTAWPGTSGWKAGFADRNPAYRPVSDPKLSGNERLKRTMTTNAGAYFSHAFVDEGIRLLSAVSYDMDLASGLQEEMAEYDYSGFLTSLDIPVLSVTGASDTVIPPEHISEISKHISECRHEVFPTKHFPFVEDRDGFCRLVQAFVQDEAR